MNLAKFATLYNAGAVKRYHTMRVHEHQSLAAHSWGIAMILAAICDEPPSGELLLAALTHDLAEIETGDVPAPMKWNDQDLSDSLYDAGTKFDREHGIVFDLSDQEYQLLQWADTFELILFCAAEINMGNKAIVSTYNRGKIRLKSYGFPNHNAEDLFYTLLKERL